MLKAIKLSLSLGFGENTLDVEAFVRVNNLISHKIDHGNSLCSRQLIVLVESCFALERCIAAVELGSEFSVRFINSDGKESAEEQVCHKAVMTSAAEFGSRLILNIDLLEPRPSMFRFFK